MDAYRLSIADLERTKESDVFEIVEKDIIDRETHWYLDARLDKIKIFGEYVLCRKEAVSLLDRHIYWENKKLNDTDKKMLRMAAKSLCIYRGGEVSGGGSMPLAIGERMKYAMVFPLNQDNAGELTDFVVEWRTLGGTNKDIVTSALNLIYVAYLKIRLEEDEDDPLLKDLLSPEHLNKLAGLNI